MQIPLEIDFHGVDRSPALEARIRELATRLERFSDHIARARVVVGARNRNHQQGNLFDATVHVTLPGGQVVAHGGRPEDPARQDVYLAVRDAFRAARRQLQDLERRRRGDVKTHAEAGARMPP